MAAAIYARKSTVQRGDEETRSIARQVADARSFAVRLALPPIDDRHIYIDEAVSGADVKGLRARARLMADVEAGKITTVIMADMSRFSRREGHEVVAELEQVARKAAVYFYETGARYAFGDIGTNIANYAVAEANADYRRKVRTKTIAAMKQKASAGHALGPAPFGYRNHDVLTGRVDAVGRAIRSHVTRVVYAPEATVVVQIFERYAAGDGLKKIAAALNKAHTLTPRSRGIASWRPSNVRSLLLQPLYRGTARSNRLKQHDDRGNPILEINPAEEHIQQFNAEWQIVPSPLAEAVDAKFADETRKKFGPKGKVGARAKYLLSGGMLLCQTCGGRFDVLNNGRYQYYVCSTHRHAGNAVCNNPLALKVAAMDDYMLALLDQQVLHPRFVGHVLNLACGDGSHDARPAIEAQRDEVTRKIGRLVALSSGLEDVPEIQDAIKKHQAERHGLDRRLAALAEPIDRPRLKAALEQRCKDWKQRLRSDFPEEARFVVQQLLKPVVLWNIPDVGLAPETAWEDFPPGIEAMLAEPDPDDLAITAVITPQGLLSGLVANSMVAGARSQLYLAFSWSAA